MHLGEPIWEEDGLNDQDDDDDDDDDDDEQRRACESAAAEAMAAARQLVPVTAPGDAAGGVSADEALAAALAAARAAYGNSTRGLRTWADEEGFVQQGGAGCRDFMREMMCRSGVPTNKRVLPPTELAPSEWAAGAPRLQPYQETVRYHARRILTSPPTPSSLPQSQQHRHCHPHCHPHCHYHVIDCHRLYNF